MAKAIGTAGTRGSAAGAREEVAGFLTTGHEVDALTGHLDGVDDEGRLLFKVEGEDRSVPVAIGLDMQDDALVQAALLGRRGLVIRTSEARPRLVLVGLVRERVANEARERKGMELQAKMDGETVRLRADSRIELSCGKARITLYEDGRIEISGTHLVNRSRGPVKIKGATVEIN